MGNNEPTDAELVASVLSGDREAFGRLYDRYARLVRAVVYDVASDWSTVQDLTQECFLRAYQNLARLRQPDRFGHWLVGIARQVAPGAKANAPARPASSSSQAKRWRFPRSRTQPVRFRRPRKPRL